MNRCPITYEECGEQLYSEKGLKSLSRSLNALHLFPYSAKEQIQLAADFAAKLSIQGIQPKLSIKLIASKGEFIVVEKGGRYILKPPHQVYEELPQNEDLTMKLGSVVAIDAPCHGMIYNKDNSLSYFIKRFDRVSSHHKLATEDFAQLMGFSRDTKYESSMEQLIPILDKHCTFPLIEKIKLFRLTLFNFLIGNEDMHLKNFSLIRYENKVELSPAYDLLNSSIVLRNPEEIALPLRGKKSKLKREELIDYFGLERLKLLKNVIDQELETFQKAFATWEALVRKSFLSAHMQDKYLDLISERRKRLKL